MSTFKLPINKAQNFCLFLCWIFPLALFNYAKAARMQLSSSPGYSLQQLRNEIENAHSEILMNIYQFSSPEIGEALVQKINQGVAVTILKEGSPVGGMSLAELNLRLKICQAMQKQNPPKSLWIEMRNQGQGRRFRFNHAKYTIIDQKVVIVGSQNYVPNGLPEERKKGSLGWQVAFEDSATLNQFREIFAADSQTNQRDVEDLSRKCADPNYRRLKFTEEASASWLQVDLPDLPVQDENLEATQSLVSSENLPETESLQVSAFFSPSSSLSAIQNLLRTAEKEILIEQMTFDAEWNKAETNPLIGVLQERALNGIKVQILLNDESVFERSILEIESILTQVKKFFEPSPRLIKEKNTRTQDLLNRWAELNQVDLEVRIANLKALKALYIHNKGVVVDSAKTMVSSVNWNETSFLKNREAGVIVEGYNTSIFYKNIFNQHWNASAFAK